MNDGMMIVNFAALQQASADIHVALATLQGELDGLERDAGPLVHTWDGQAKEAYLARQTSWRQAAADLTVMLREIRRALDESAADYAHTERRNVELFRG
jgi:WXG100 family type VII secretion target